jgi:hypothetical protein
MDEHLQRLIIFKQRRYLRKEKLKQKRMKPRKIPVKHRIRRGRKCYMILDCLCKSYRFYVILNIEFFYMYLTISKIYIMLFI